MKYSDSVKSTWLATAFHVIAALVGTTSKPVFNRGYSDLKEGSNQMRQLVRDKIAP